MKKTFFTVLFTLTLIACNTKEKELLTENISLKSEIKSLKKQIDSLNNLPSTEFEKIAIKDKILDTLRNIKEQTYTPNLDLNKLKTNDSILMDEYKQFAQKHPNSILSIVAFDRGANIYHKSRMLSYNQIVGTYKLDSIKGLCFTKDYKTKINERLEITKDKKIKIYANNKLIEAKDFYLKPIKFGGTEMHIKEKGIYAISLKANNLLSLGKAYIIGSEYKIYERIE